MITAIHFSDFQANIETFARLLIKKSAKKRKIEEEEYLEDAEVFFPARGGDDEEAVGIVTHDVLQTVQNRPKKQRIPNRDRVEHKKLWRDGYATWANEEFKDSLRIALISFYVESNKIL